MSAGQVQQGRTSSQLRPDLGSCNVDLADFWFAYLHFQFCSNAYPDIYNVFS